MDKIVFSITNNYNYRFRTPLVLPVNPGVDVSGPPALTGPDGPDEDVQPEPDKTSFPSACNTLKYCKLLTDGRYKWEKMPKADNLRAVRRFRLRFPWVCWAQAEDYIWEKFQTGARYHASQARQGE